MLNAEEQIEVLALVSSTKNLILSEQEKAEVTVKGAADYVTNVDVAVQEFLKRELAERFPDVRMLAEEQVNTGFVKEGKYWILDPIDGTTNLIHDMKLSAVALGTMKMERSRLEPYIIRSWMSCSMRRLAAGRG